jgi:hypothetical protein
VLSNRLIGGVSVAALFAALVSSAHAADTSVQWGADRTVSPWSICLYDSANACQSVLTLPASGGGALIPTSVGGLGVNAGSATGIPSFLSGVASISTTLPSGLALGTIAGGNLAAGTGYLASNLSGLGTGVATLLGGASTGMGGLVGSIAPTLTGGVIQHDGLVLVGKATGSFPVFFNNSTDDSASINSAITALYNSGGGTLWLPPGAAFIGSTINLRSFVRVEGSPGTILVCHVTPCVSQLSGSQLARAAFNHIAIEAAAASQTAIYLTSAQHSEFGWLAFPAGFTGTGSKFLDIEAATPTTYDDVNLGPNTIFNEFHDWQGYEGGSAGSPVDTAITISGAYTASPPAVGLVVTQNAWRNINVWDSNHCVNVIRAADTNYFYNLLCATHTASTTQIVLANDATYPSQNVGVGTNKFFGVTFSGSSFANPVTYFGGNWTNGNAAYGINSDVTPANVTIDAIGTSVGNCWYGALDTAGANFAFENTCTNSSGFGSVAAVDTKELQSLTNGQTYVVPAGYRNLTLTNSLIAGATITFPCPARDGDKFSVSVTGGGVTALSYAGCSGVSSLGGAGTLTSGGEEFLYYGASKTWVRSQ